MNFLKAIFIISLFVSIGFAQTSTSRLLGLIDDQSNAVLPDTSVTVTDEKTGQEYKATTDTRGQYIFAQLPPSTYSVVASKSGFANHEEKHVVLQVGQEVTRNITLQLGNVSSTVLVDSGALATIDTSSARIGMNVSEREVAQLPINGRQVSQLYLLAPGAVNSGGGAFDNIRFSGRSNRSRYFWIRSSQTA